MRNSLLAALIGAVLAILVSCSGGCRLHGLKLEINEGTVDPGTNISVLLPALLAKSASTNVGSNTDSAFAFSQPPTNSVTSP